MPSDLRPGPDSPPTDELASAEVTLGILQQVLHPMSRDEWSKPTPCSEYDVAQLTDHLLNSTSVLGGAAGAEMPDRDPEDSVERQVVIAGRHALDAWHRRGLDGRVTIGPNELPAAVAVGILSLEFLVHAWDYATATGRSVPAAEPAAQYVLELARQIITPANRATVGFAEPVDVAETAPTMDQLIAFTGRQP
jgi:uncharacterized protein (TIGR03086 family)